MDHQGAIDHILNRLKTELSESLTYHGHHHTLDVMEATERIGRSEKVSDYEMNMLLVAAAFHDCGFLLTYVDHELAGCTIARKTLPQFGFFVGETEQICAMIMATKVPQEPKSRLADILCDADLDYLGRDDFKSIGDTLFEELKYIGILQHVETWNRIQVKFLSAHRYHTAYGKANREATKQAHLNDVMEEVATYKD